MCSSDLFPSHDKLTFIVKSTEFYVPAPQNFDLGNERKKLMEELEYTKRFLSSVNSKLNNEGFRKHASQKVIENELKKKADAEERIRLLREKLDQLNRHSK